MTQLSGAALGALAPAEQEAERLFAVGVVRSMTDSRLTTALAALTSLMTDYDEKWPARITATWAIRIEAIVHEIDRRQKQGPFTSMLRRMRLSIGNGDVGAIEKLGSASMKGPKR